MGGSNDPSNLYECSVEQHAELHLALYLEQGHWQDWIAYHTLSGQITIDEARRKAASEYMTNRVIKPESIEKMRKKRKEQGNFRLGTTHREDSKEKMKLSAIAHRGRKVKCVETGQVWNSPILAGEELNIPWKQIRKAADPKQPRNKSAKGFHFQFEEVS